VSPAGGNPEVSFLISGLVLGVSAGISPGPLLTLVMTQTLKHGIGEGIKVSLAPLLTDLPIVLLALFVLHRLTALDTVLGCIALFGAGYLFYLGYESMTFGGADFTARSEAPHSFKKGIVANFLNPNPYMFWFAIGGPLVLKAFSASTMAVLVFMAAFYLLLVGAKCVVAVVAGSSRHFLKSRLYVYTVRGLGIVLCVFGFIFAKDAFHYFDWL